MPRAEKVEKVKELAERIRGSQALLLTGFEGLSVADATELRRALAEADARFSVVKNTLFKLAAEEAGLAELERLLQGPTAVTFAFGDPVAAAKRVVDAARRFPALVLKGAWLEGRVLSAEDAQRLATLESREALLARVAGALVAELARAAYAFQAVQARFLAVLEAYREKRSAEPAAGGATAGVAEGGDGQAATTAAGDDGGAPAAPGDGASDEEGKE
ncbi:MAG TPA: 50S ribosomal protein L10 [Actinomycetota bacterium]|nr:50S ribosomal protein L10 [Actinomycetota bacterium]